MIEAILGLVPSLNRGNVPSVAGGFNDFYSNDLFFQNAAFGVLYFIISIWLLFGIKTNIVSAVGGILLVLPAMVVPELGGTELATKLALAAVFAVPLAFFGGGRYAIMDRGNWREAF